MYSIHTSVENEQNNYILFLNHTVSELTIRQRQRHKSAQRVRINKCDHQRVSWLWLHSQACSVASRRHVIHAIHWPIRLTRRTRRAVLPANSLLLLVDSLWLTKAYRSSKQTTADRHDTHTGTMTLMLIRYRRFSHQLKNWDSSWHKSFSAAHRKFQRSVGRPWAKRCTAAVSEQRKRSAENTGGIRKQGVRRRRCRKVPRE